LVNGFRVRRTCLWKSPDQDVLGKKEDMSAQTNFRASDMLGVAKPVKKVEPKVAPKAAKKYVEPTPTPEPVVVESVVTEETVAEAPAEDTSTED
jgi:hypothetical protein|tara:strand:- start:2468 stop:2749 length:282 start_codon:yes stop_codon:yes gene_type:complete